VGYETASNEALTVLYLLQRLTPEEPSWAVVAIAHAEGKARLIAVALSDRDFNTFAAYFDRGFVETGASQGEWKTLPLAGKPLMEEARKLNHLIEQKLEEVY